MNYSIKIIIILCAMGYSFDTLQGAEERPSAWWKTQLPTLSFNWRQYIPAWIEMPEETTVARIKDFLGLSITGYLASSGMSALAKNLTKDIDPVKAGFLIIAAGLAGGGSILYTYFRDVRIMRDLIHKVNSFESEIKKSQNNYKKLQDLINEGNVLLTSILEYAKKTWSYEGTLQSKKIEQQLQDLLKTVQLNMKKIEDNDNGILDKTKSYEQDYIRATRAEQDLHKRYAMFLYESSKYIFLLDQFLQKVQVEDVKNKLQDIREERIVKFKIS